MRLNGWLVLLFLLPLLGGCGEQRLQRESYVFGTRVQITVAGADADSAAPAVDAALAGLDQLHADLHPWQPGPLRRLNEAFARGQSAPVSAELAELIQLAQQHWQLSGGHFNPAIGGLVRLWGFHADTIRPRLPTPAERQPWLAARPDPTQVSVENGQARSSNPAVQLDFGGMAKGWALDRVSQQLRLAGVRHALINIGGNVMALGRNGDRPWRVGLQHPRLPQALLELDLHDGEAIGTSGDYQRYFMLDGQRYSHLLDPQRGEPARLSSSATVLVQPRAHAGLISDVASKPLFIGGPQQASQLARRYGLRTWLVVAPDGKVYLSETMRTRVHWLTRPAALIYVRP